MTIARRPGEPLLGNPDTDGKVLSSTTAGVRSWVGIIDADHRAAVTGIHGIVAKGANLRGVGLGPLAIENSTTDEVVGIGYGAARLNTTARTTAVGYLAGYTATTSIVTALGYRAAIYATKPVTAVGYDAGAFLADGSTPNSTADAGTYIGMSTRGSVAGASNETVIGYGAVGGGSNTVRIGNGNVVAWVPGATNKTTLGSATLAFKGAYFSDGTDEWLMTVNTSGAPVFTKV